MLDNILNVEMCRNGLVLAKMLSIFGVNTTFRSVDNLITLELSLSYQRAPMFMYLSIDGRYLSNA